jgi:hypothetical protein
MTTEPTDNRAAVEAFIDERVKVLALLARLTEQVENHYDLNPDAVTWQHSGDLRFVRERLEQCLSK